MERDAKELVGALMQVLGGEEISPSHVETLSFDATGELETVLNEAFIKLLEFAHDYDIRQRDKIYDAGMRAEIQQLLNRIGVLAGPVESMGLRNAHGSDWPHLAKAG